MPKHDVVIVGGAIVGSAVAYFLKRIDPACDVAVVEPDSTYEFSSTLRASGGARRQFSCPENIAMSNVSIDFIAGADELLAVDGVPAQVEWRQGGYLFIVGPADVDALRANHAVQREQGVVAHWLDTDALRARFPSMNLDGIVAGVHTPQDGWCDPNGLLQGLRLRRFEHYFETPNRIEPLPYVKDTARLAFRPEGKGYSGGLVNSAEPRGYNFDVDHDYFERVVWPALAFRFPAFEACRCRRTWSGLYEQNELDGNPVIGAWSGQMENFFVAAGFSGHGMMHAPAAGRAIAELALHRRFETLDLAALGYARIPANRPYAERGIL
jgi:glycine/D-amino acid oxidase-like deaminating enzyme